MSQHSNLMAVSMAPKRDFVRSLRAMRLTFVRRIRAFRMKPAPEDDLLTVGIGTYFDGAPGIVRYPGDKAPVRFGKFCSVAKGATFLPGGNHRVDWVTTSPLHQVLGLPMEVEHPASKGPIVVGNDVWIGRDSVVLSGVTIGDGAVVAAGAIVTRDVLPYVIVAGNPARLIRHRFDDQTVAALQKIAWWDWPADVIRSRASDLLSSDIARFIELYQE
jgi:virginiamycin A acetyltransferase